MKSFVLRITKALTILTAAVFFAFAINGATAYIGPDCDPTDANCTIYPHFYTFVVDSALTGAGSGAGSIRVYGDLEVVGTLYTDEIEADNFNTPVTFSSDFEATSIGYFYVVENRCTNCNTYVADSDYMGIKRYMYSNIAICDTGDIMLGCSGWIESTLTSSKYYGSDIYKSIYSETYYCQTLSSFQTMTTNAVCWSPDYSSNTGDI